MPHPPSKDAVAALVALYPQLVSRYPTELPPLVAERVIATILGADDEQPMGLFTRKASPGPTIAELRKKPEPDGKAFRLRVVLQYTDPAVWRVIDMPTMATFWELHVAIQDAFGWLDEHLHQYRVGSDGQGVGIPIHGPDMGATDAPGWECYIAPYFREVTEATYTYDFGDDWIHAISLESIVDAGPGTDPRLVDGANATPPEDCGGPGGYEELKRVLAGKKNATYRSMKEWLSEGHAKVYWPFDPTAFDPDEVQFTHAGFRLKRMLKELSKRGY